MNIVGNGVVIDPVTLKKEIDALLKMKVDVNQNFSFPEKLMSLFLPTVYWMQHPKRAKERKIGSTLRGIGPTYMDKTGRNGLRVGDIEASDFMDRYTRLRNKHMELLNHMNFSYSLEELEAPFLKLWKKCEN